MLTFLIPATWATFHLLLKEKSSIVFKTLKEEFLRQPKGYLSASFFSSAQFIFSVFALALPGSRFFVAMLLGLSPLLTVFLDKNKRTDFMIKLEYFLALLACIGLVMISNR